MTNNVYTIKTKIEALREERAVKFFYLTNGNFIDPFTKRMLSKSIDRISLEIAKAGHEIDKLIWSGKGAL